MNGIERENKRKQLEDLKRQIEILEQEILPKKKPQVNLDNVVPFPKKNKNLPVVNWNQLRNSKNREKMAMGIAIDITNILFYKLAAADIPVINLDTNNEQRMAHEAICSLVYRILGHDHPLQAVTAQIFKDISNFNPFEPEESEEDGPGPEYA